MTATASPAARPAFRLTPTIVMLLALAALAWAGVLAYASAMGNGPGSMGLPLREFMPMWGVMMAAMMLPAVAPVASLYARTIKSRRGSRLAVFVAGYLVVWAAAGVPTYALLRLVDRLTRDSGNITMRSIAVVALVAAGTYQLSPLKTRCLQHCRSPLAQLLHYGNMKGRLRDLKVAVHHSAYCLGCCWALMVLFIAFGVMNVWAMLGLAAVVVSEKVLRRGETVGRLAGAACLVFAVLVLMSPAVADALVPSMGPDPGTMHDMDASVRSTTVQSARSGTRRPAQEPTIGDREGRRSTPPSGGERFPGRSTRRARCWPDRRSRRLPGRGATSEARSWIRTARRPTIRCDTAPGLVERNLVSCVVRRIYRAVTRKPAISERSLARRSASWGRTLANSWRSFGWFPTSSAPGIRHRTLSARPAQVRLWVTVRSAGTARNRGLPCSRVTSVSCRGTLALE